MAGILMTDPGFGRGHTLGVADVAQGTSVTGTQKTFTDSDPRTTNAGKFYSNRAVTCIAVRNTSGAALLPGAVVEFDATAILDAVDGSSADGTGLTGVVDEYLPATGCAALDVCWVVVSGPTAITTAGSFSAGDALAVADGAAAASAGDDVFGYAISPEANGKVRALVGTVSEHSAA
jgi:hypothetical protein